MEVQGDRCGRALITEMRNKYAVICEDCEWHPEGGTWG